MSYSVSSPYSPAASFEQTRWSLILRSVDNDPETRKKALNELCQSYWYPLYAFMRRIGRNSEDAQDLVQEFFAKLLDGTLLSGATPTKGKFRTLLLSALKNQDANAWAAAKAQKRGGNAKVISLDVAMAEDLWQTEAPSNRPLEATFDRAWANTVMNRASLKLQSEYVDSGKSALFAELFPRLNGGSTFDTLADVALRLGMTEAAVKMALSRMRPRYADLLRNEIAQTVGSHADVQEELRYLLTVFL